MKGRNSLKFFLVVMVKVKIDNKSGESDGVGKILCGWKLRVFWEFLKIIVYVFWFRIVG